MPNLNNFIFSNKKIFSIGDFAFRVNGLTEKDKKVSGVTGAVNHDLENINSEKMNGKIVYKSNASIIPLSSSPVLVYTSLENLETTEITFNNNEGILLLINEKITTEKEYSSNIIWTIEE